MHSRESTLDIAAPGTCTWVLENLKFEHWRSHGGVLLIEGNPGSGKSTLMDFIIRHVERASPDDVIVASHFFHSSGDPLHNTPEGMIRSLLHQIVGRRQAPLLLSFLGRIYRNRRKNIGDISRNLWHWQESELKESLKMYTYGTLSDHVVFSKPSYTSETESDDGLSQSFDKRKRWSYRSDSTAAKKILLFIDAIDEVDKEKADDLVEYLKSLTSVSSKGNIEKAPSVAVCCSSRRYPHTVQRFRLESISLEEHNRDDIQEYAKQKIENLKDVQDDSELWKKISRRAEGNFLWTRLFIHHAIKDGVSLKAALDNTRAVTEPLAKLYNDTLRSLNPEDRAASLKLFRWMSCARRPLTLNELGWAMIIEEQKSFIECQRSMEFQAPAETMALKLAPLSRGLAVRRLNRADFIHKSVLDFLVDKGLAILEQPPIGTSVGMAHLSIAKRCIHYMKLVESQDIDDEEHSDSDSSLCSDPDTCKSSLDSGSFRDYVFEHWFEHVRKIALDQLQHDLHQHSDQSSVKNVHEGAHQMPKHASNPYALLNILLSERMDRVIVRWFQQWIRGRDASKNKLSSPGKHILSQFIREGFENQQPALRYAFIHLAAGFNLRHALKASLSISGTFAGGKDDQGRTPLIWAASLGHLGIMKTLTKKREDVLIDVRDKGGRTALSWAAGGGHTEAVRLLISKNAKINLVDKSSRSPLQFAIRGGHHDVQKELEHTITDVAPSKKYQSVVARSAITQQADKGWLWAQKQILDDLIQEVETSPLGDSNRIDPKALSLLQERSRPKMRQDS